MPATQRCPTCFLEVSASAFQCPRCELLLIGDVNEVVELNARPKTDPPSLVRWLMEEPQAELHREPPAPPPLESDATRATRPMRLPPALDVVPAVIAALRMTELNLTPFEAWVVSMMDGRTPGNLLAAALSLSELEMRIVIQTLVEKNVISLGKKAPAAPRPAPAAAPSLADSAAFMREMAARMRPGASAPPAPAPAQPAAPDRDQVAAGALQTALSIEKTGNLKEAARFLEIAIAQSPDAAPLYNRLALVLVRERGDYREAERLLSKALEISPRSDVYLHNLEAVRQRLQKRKS